MTVGYSQTCFVNEHAFYYELQLTQLRTLSGAGSSSPVSSSKGECETGRLVAFPDRAMGVLLREGVKRGSGVNCCPGHILFM